ncbi:hypothetical protein Agabi119p4_7354 [Agaricus bisporus var. burnettii]|uniref:DUF6534 domain-containing protein n=1 Tax=Agaricus bisporus var. burnettii TaxID=192524 RepID=A0A8H7EYZ1_AGABI|nr:hypothetical protein Agabi119p4_7354 [Agaricus bisporus var. burnettii]
MIDIESTLGVLLIGVFINTYLYGVVSYQYAKYSVTFKKDPHWVKLMVFVLFLMDTVHSASIIYMVWTFAVKSFEGGPASTNAYWPYPFTVLVMVCTACIVQGFFTYRIWKLTSQHTVACALAVLIVGAFVLGVTVAVRAWKLKPHTSIGPFNSLLAAWLVMEVVVDASIAGILIYKLSMSKTGHKNSDSVLNRLIRMSVQTGFCTGVFAVLCLIFFFVMPRTQYFAMFGIPISRVYTITFMDALLGRSGLRDLLFLDPDEVGRSASRGARTLSAAIRLQVTKEVYTVTDREVSEQAHEMKVHRV